MELPARKSLNYLIWFVAFVYLTITILNWAPYLSTTTSLIDHDKGHAWLAWAQTDMAYPPLGDPILYDPGNVIPRVALIIPHTVLALVRRFVDPRLTWALAITFGAIALLLVMRWLFRLDGATGPVAVLGALALVLFGDLLRDFPPLTLNQLQSVIHFLTFNPDNLALRFYGFSVEYFSIPYLFLLIAITLRLTKDQVRWGLTRQGLKWWVWIVLCWLLPLVYFYHWLEFAALLVILLPSLWWQGKVTRQWLSRLVFGPGLIVGLGWLVYFVAQNALTNSPAGREYMLAVGLQEARFSIVDWPGLVRYALFLLFTLVFLRPLVRMSVLFQTGLILWAETFLLQNIQLVVGRTIQPLHFGFLGIEIVPLCWACVAIYAWQQLMGSQKIATTLANARPVLNVIAIGAILAALWRVNLGWKLVIADSQLDQNTQSLMQYFARSPETKVFLTDDIRLESNLIFLLSKHSYLPWGALSSVEPMERMQRAVFAWRLLRVSGDPAANSFGQWLQLHSWHLFHMKFGTTLYSSTLFYDPATKPQVLAFNDKSILPAAESRLYDAVKDIAESKYRIDVVIYKGGDPVPACVHNQAVLYSNPQYKVYQAPTHCM